jgi:hypothetical protein
VWAPPGIARRRRLEQGPGVLSLLQRCLAVPEAQKRFQSPVSLRHNDVTPVTPVGPVAPVTPVAPVAPARPAGEWPPLDQEPSAVPPQASQGGSQLGAAQDRAVGRYGVARGVAAWGCSGPCSWEVWDQPLGQGLQQAERTQGLSLTSRTATRMCAREGAQLDEQDSNQDVCMGGGSA